MSFKRFPAADGFPERKPQRATRSPDWIAKRWRKLVALRDRAENNGERDSADRRIRALQERYPAQVKAAQGLFDREAREPEDRPLFVEPDLDWEPSSDQEVALKVILAAFEESGAYALTGAAGSGKTTLMRIILLFLASHWDIVLCAMTWKAAARLKEVTGRPAASFHRVVYGAPTEERRCIACGEWSARIAEGEDVKCWLLEDGAVQLSPPWAEVDRPEAAVQSEVQRNACDCGEIYEFKQVRRLEDRLVFLPQGIEGTPGTPRLVVIDEASMMSQDDDRAAREALLEEDGCTRILKVGDPNQLPAILTSEQKTRQIEGEGPLDRPTAMLLKVHRQAEGNPILTLARRFLTHPEVMNEPHPIPRDMPAGILVKKWAKAAEVADWLIDHWRNRPDPRTREDAVLVTYANRDRALLNRVVRDRAGWTAYANQLGLPIAPGERMLARAGCRGVMNGELWVIRSIEAIPPGTALLDDGYRAKGRSRGGKKGYLRDLAIGQVAVFRAEIIPAGIPLEDAEVEQVVIVLPVRNGRPVFESDLILADTETPPQVARNDIRRAVNAWKSEYREAIEGYESDWERDRGRLEAKTHGIARWADAAARGNRDAAEDALSRVVESSVGGRMAEFDAASTGLLERMERGDFFGYAVLAKEAAHNAFAEPEDDAVRAKSLISYCIRKHGAIDPSTVGVFDRGDCLTCHSCQGSQFQHVAVVHSYRIFGLWRHERIEAMQWLYTAYSRAQVSMAIFDLARSEAG